MEKGVGVKAVVAMEAGEEVGSVTVEGMVGVVMEEVVKAVEVTAEVVKAEAAMEVGTECGTHPHTVYSGGQLRAQTSFKWAGRAVWIVGRTWAECYVFQSKLSRPRPDKMARG